MKLSLLLKNVVKLLLDSGLLIGYLYMMHNEQHSTDYSVYWHEWIGLAGILVVLYHLFLNRKWLIALPGMFKKANFRQFINIFIVVLLVLNTTLTGLTGILIATTLNAAFLQSPNAGTIQSAAALHRLCAHLFIPIIVLHIGLHWRWVKSTIRQVFVKSRRADIQNLSVPNTDL